MRRPAIAGFFIMNNMDESLTANSKQPHALTDPKRIKEIYRNIKSGEAWLKNGNYSGHEYRSKMWKRNKAWLRCDWNVDGQKDESEFHVNTPFADFHTVRPSLVFKAPYINVEAKKPEFEKDENGEILKDENGKPTIKSDNYLAARLLQTRINHEIKQIGLKAVIKRCVGHSNGYYGIGWAKVGYQGLTVSLFNNDRDNKTNYWVDWVDPRDVIFDWTAVEAKKMHWIAQRITMSRERVKELGLKIPDHYNVKLADHLEERNKQAEAGNGSSFDERTSSDLIVFYEYHDLDQRTVDWVLIDGSADTWFFMAETSVDPYPFEGSCFKPLVLTEDDDDLIGITDIEPVKDHILALNRMRTREVYHMDNYGTGVFYEDGAIDEKQKDNYKNTPFGFMTKLKAGGINKVKIEGTPSMGSDHYNMSSVLKEEIRNTIGITDYQQGGASVQRKATEAQIIRSDATLRVEDKRDVIADFVIEIVRALAAMIQEFDDEMDFYDIANEEFGDDYVEVLKREYGYNPKIPFLGISREQIQGEFNFSFNIEDMIMQPKEVRAAQLARSIQAISSNELLLRKFMEDHDINKVITDMFELNGVDIKKYNKGGPVQLNAVLENEMFRNGMEVPDPHRKDDDDEHLITHGVLRRELEQAISEAQGKIAKLQGGMQMLPEMMAGNPNAFAIQQQAQQQIDVVTQQMEPLEQQLRRLKLHMQDHVQQAMRKEGESEMSGGGGGNGQGPQTGLPAQPPQQAALSAPAQPPIGGSVV